MTSDSPTPTNWFAGDGAAYARFRPDYPADLVDALADLAPGTRRAVDVGCGTGQLTVRLADRFAEVVGVDPSASQIAAASAHPHVRYVVAPAERLPVGDTSADLVTAAQAAHWFRLPAFYSEARRIARPGAVLALVSYGLLAPPPAIAERFERFHADELARFWPPQRRLVDEGYRTIDFPFEDLPAPSLRLAREFTLETFLGYVSTWSAVRNAAESGECDLLARFAAEIADLWGDPTAALSMTWPLNLRLARLWPRPPFACATNVD